MAIRLDKISPKTKRLGALAISIVVLLFVVSLFTGSPDQERKRRDDAIITSVLTDSNAREIGIDAMAARLETLETKLRLRDRELDKTREDLDRIKNNTGRGDDVGRQIEQLQKTVSVLAEQNAALKERVSGSGTINYEDESGFQGTSEGSRKTGAEGVRPANVNRVARDEVDPREYFKNAPIPTFGDTRKTQTGSTEGQGTEKESAQAAPARQIEIEDVGAATDKNAVADKTTSEENDDNDGIYIPMGSLLTGTLLTGLDAPTGQGARRDPFPVVLRIQKEAILPNHYLADVRECMVILSGYGELSSERVYLRSEGISCVREDGKSIEARLNGYSVGEDGKAGIRGRLVTKQGQLIARSLVAGFMSGVAEAFDVNPVPVIDTNPTGDQIRYLDAFNDKAVQGGLVSGASSALDRIADFYLKLADSVYPVLELDAGRQIDIVLVKGASLKIQ